MLKETLDHHQILEATLQSLGDGVVVVDEKGKFLVFNPAAEKILNAGPATIKPGEWAKHYSLFLPDKATPFPSEELPLVRAMRGESVDRVEIFMRRADRPAGIWLSVTARPLRNKDGKIQGGVAIFRDVTARLQTQEILNSLLESAPDAMVIVDSTGKISRVNAQTAKLFGYTRVELIDQPVELLIPERFRKNHVHHREKYAREPKVRPMGIGLELFGRRKDGTEFPVEISLSPIETPEGKLFSSAIRDISDRKKLEKERETYAKELSELNSTLEEKVADRTAKLIRAQESLQEVQEQFYQAQKMESLGALAGGMAHEFGNLLAVMRLYSDDKNLDLAKVRQAEKEAEDLVSEILLFARRQSGKSSTINLNELVKNLTKVLLGIMGDRVSLSTKLDPELPSMEAHPGQIQQILMNLVLNARDAMPQGGEVEIVTRTVLADGKKLVELSVKDTGSGMDEETLAHIFDPFFTTKKAGKGTGLGLSVVYGIVKNHQGNIKVETGRGQGSLFILHFPAV